MRDWEKAIEHLDYFIKMYSALGVTGAFGVGLLRQLKERYDSGERSKKLYREIMEVE